MECLVDVRVHLYRHVLLENDILVSLVYALLDPVCEGLAKHAVRDVKAPVARKLTHFPIVGIVNLRLWCM